MIHSYLPCFSMISVFHRSLYKVFAQCLIFNMVISLNMWDEWKEVVACKTLRLHSFVSMNDFICFIVCFEVKMLLRNIFWIIQGRYSLILFVSFFAGSAFTQQELPACKPLLTPGWVCVWAPHILFEYWFYSSKTTIHDQRLLAVFNFRLSWFSWWLELSLYL